MVVFEEHPASILSADVCMLRNWFGYVEKLKESGHSDPWEGVRKWSVIQRTGRKVDFLSQEGNGVVR
jgi:hypothetical protein